MEKILLASVLKPCDDTRMYEKFALSLSKKYQIIIAGSGNAPTNQPNIHFKSLLSGYPNLLKRQFAWLKFFLLLLKNRPDIVVVHCPELLPILFIYKCLSKCKVIYDIRENYFYNIFYQPNYHGLLKYLLAYGVRAIERFSTIFIHGYTLAEKCYDIEFAFHKKKYCVLENKYARPIVTKRNELGRGFHFVFTGTISATYGIWEALHLIDALHEHCQKVTFTLAGHIVNAKLNTEIKSFIKSRPYINLVEGFPLVSHVKIIEILSTADFALLPYRPNKSTEGCIPTKLYEALALKIPMLIQNNTMWKKLCDPYQAALFLDFSNYNLPALLKSLKYHKFYTHIPDKEVLWESEEKKLLDFISEL